MTSVAKPCTPDVSLKKSLKEMLLIRQGKLPKRSWKQFKKQLEDDLHLEVNNESAYKVRVIVTTQAFHYWDA
ncbi:MAG: hypothetical protein KAX49_10495 [Halanaerobiales bacterium]|nr:hypothetical protein [Halanaerobiales bacterium]